MKNDMISLHPGGLVLTRAAATAAHMKAGDRVLDVGCGTGTSLAHLADNFGIIPFGIDVSEAAAQKARMIHPKLDIRVADAAYLPFKTGSFHHVLMECVLSLLDSCENVPSEVVISEVSISKAALQEASFSETALSEAVRVLRPGGKLIISTLTGAGTVDAGQLDEFLSSLGLTCVHREDRTKDLTQYMIDTIMEYGSLEERIRAEQEATGASVFDCSCSLDPKKTGYHLFVYACGVGTPVDRLVAERIGVTPENLTQEVVEQYQLEALRRTVRYAKERSVFYRSHLAGVDPDKLVDMESIRSIPTTGEMDLAGNEGKFQCLSQSMVDRIVTVPVIDNINNLVTLPTSGTGGRRKRISYTANDQQRSIDFINRGFLTMDCTEGERMLIFMSGTAPGSIGDLVARAMAPLHMEIKVYGAVTDIADAYKALTEFRPAVVEALPWHAAALARYGTRYGNPEKDFIRSVNLSADVVPDAIVERLENLWECSVHRHYGTTEMAIFGGVECANHKGYHTRPCDILYEIPETDSEGYGELLITTLDREAMPFIRYRTGDIARFADEPCPCGCRIRRIERFKGRRTSLVSLKQGSFYLSELADALYRIPEVIDFDLVLRRGDDGECVGAGGGAFAEQPVKCFAKQSTEQSTEQSAEQSTREVAGADIIVRTLPGESISREVLEKVIHRFEECCVDSRGGIASGMCIRPEETLHFPTGYNLKKKIL